MPCHSDSGPCKGELLPARKNCPMPSHFPASPTGSFGSHLIYLQARLWEAKKGPKSQRWPEEWVGLREATSHWVEQLCDHASRVGSSAGMLCSVWCLPEAGGAACFVQFGCQCSAKGAGLGLEAVTLSSPLSPPSPRRGRGIPRPYPSCLGGYGKTLAPKGLCCQVGGAALSSRAALPGTHGPLEPPRLPWCCWARRSRSALSQHKHS